MKRYEKMSKEEIMESYNRTINFKCRGCLHARYCEDSKDCVGAINKWLNEEIEVIPRCHTFKDESDFQEAWNDWGESDHDMYPTIASYMMEEVEA